MFCDQCGAGLQPGQLVCSSCGKILNSGQPLVPGRPGRVQQHLRILAILWLTIATITDLVGILVLLVANFLPVQWQSVPQLHGIPPGLLQVLLNVVGIFILAKGSVAFLAGWGLLKRASWARMLALILGFLSLLSVPFGTALGVYTL